MIRTYQVLLSNQQAKRFKTHLKNMGLNYTSGECGETQFIQFDYEETEIADIKTLLDEVKCHCWAENVFRVKK